MGDHPGKQANKQEQTDTSGGFTPIITVALLVK